MKRLNESNKLHKVTILHDGNQAYTFSWDGKTKVFRGTKEELAKFLMKLKAKDTESQPKSVRKARYIDMANKASGGNASVVYVFDYMLNRFPKSHYTLDKAKAEEVDWKRLSDTSGEALIEWYLE